MPATLPNCTAPGGTFTNHWTDIQDSGVEFLRIGGIAYDQCLRVPNDYTTLFTGANSFPNMITMGFTPVVQLSYYDPSTNLPYIIPSTAATNAKLIVDALYPLGVRYFTIGNEPDGQYNNNNFITGNPQNTPAGIFDYISVISTLIRGTYNAGNGNPVFLVGPEVSSYTQATITALTSGTYNVLPYIDIFSFHTYPFGDEGTTATGFKIDPTRANLINVLGNVIPVYFANSNLVTPLESQLSTLNTTITNYNNANSTTIKPAITEANICYKNDVSGTNATIGTDDLITGNGSNGLLGGQFWAEMMAISMNKNMDFLNFWSVKEGGTSSTNIGYLNGSTGNKKSSYYLFQMVAKNFKGNYLANSCTTNTSGTYKAFAYQNTTSPNEIGVVVMNQDIQSPRGTDATTKSFRINLNGSVTGTFDMKFAFNAGLSINYDCRITNETTMLLVFNSSGTLIRKEVYNLGDALRTIDTGPEVWGLGTGTPITTQAQFNSYYDAVYSDLVITPASTILEGSSDTKTFRFSNTATVNGDFEVPLGAEFTLLPTVTCP
ncbi:MAG: hypothetical protein V4549_07840 [Bacteroidota bacterium]